MKVFAQDVDYWKTGSKRSVSQWVDLARGQLVSHGAKNIVYAEGDQDGMAAFMFEFSLGDDRHRIVWPVLPARGGDATSEQSARIQAVTTLYHDIKACCVKAARYGNRSGFFSFRLLPDNTTVQQMTDADLMHSLPRIMSPAPALIESES